jgi:hypothetical protein
MTKPLVSHRRIDQLKDLAYACGLTNQDAKPFGKLSKTSTWEALLDSHKLEFERVNPVADIALTTSANNEGKALDTSGWTNDGSFPVCDFTRQNSISFLKWVDFTQLLALAFASVGIFMLTISALPNINPLNLFPPVRINIQIGAK